MANNDVYFMKNCDGRNADNIEYLNNCSNILFCGNRANGEFCEDCAVMFKDKKLTIIENISCDCPVCFETCDISVKLFNCKHQLCITCFKKIYIRYFSDEEMNAKNLHFPYPGVANEYLQRPETDEENEKWANDYPLIADWHQRFVEYITQETIRFKTSSMHRRCPLCENPVSF